MEKDKNLGNPSPETGTDKTDKNKEGEKTPQENQEKTIESLQAQKEHFREKSEKLQEELNKFQPNNNPPSEDSWKEKIDFLMENQSKGYDKEDIGQLEILAKGLNKSFSEAATLPIFTSYLESKKAKVRAEEATPSSQANAPGYPGSSANVDFRVDDKPVVDFVQDPNISREEKTAKIRELTRQKYEEIKRGEGKSNF